MYFNDKVIVNLRDTVMSFRAKLENHIGVKCKIQECQKTYFELTILCKDNKTVIHVFSIYDSSLFHETRNATLEKVIDSFFDKQVLSKIKPH